MTDTTQIIDTQVRGQYVGVLSRRLRDDLPPREVVAWAAFRCWLATGAAFILMWMVFGWVGDSGTIKTANASICGLFAGAFWLFLEVLMDIARVSRLEMPDGRLSRSTGHRGDGFDDCATAVIPAIGSESYRYGYRTAWRQSRVAKHGGG